VSIIVTSPIQWSDETRFGPANGERCSDVDRALFGAAIGTEKIFPAAERWRQSGELSRSNHGHGISRARQIASDIYMKRLDKPAWRAIRAYIYNRG
jgi:hypothetical protein